MQQIELSADDLGRLVRFAYMTCRDAALAQDLVQEAVFRVLEKQPTITSSQHAYLKATIVNVYIGWNRRRSTTEIQLEHDVALPGSRFDERLVERIAMWSALEKLSRRQQVVLALKYYESMSDGEIADLLDWRVATVRSLSARGLKALRGQSQFRNLRPSGAVAVEGQHE